jgi:hypothetical protein
LRQASREQAGRRQEDQRKCNLTHNENVAQSLSTGAVGATTATIS